MLAARLVSTRDECFIIGSDQSSGWSPVCSTARPRRRRCARFAKRSRA